MFNRPVLASASTTLGHLSALPILVDPGDAVILDYQVHSTVQMAAQLLKARGVPIHITPHNNMGLLEETIKELKPKYNKIWYMADGVYSMYGDLAPLDAIVTLLNTYEQFHLYIDDAHGMSWTGKNGVGYARGKIDHHPKMTLAVSMNKSFAAAGGALIFPDSKLAGKVRNCGGTFIFSGPIQPPMLGAAIASAKLHLSDEITIYQQKLARLYEYANRRIEDLGLPQVEITKGPLFFIPVGLISNINNIIGKMIQDGFYMNTAGFPATPMRKGGVRFALNGHLKQKDIDNMLKRLCYHYSDFLEREELSPADISKVFQIREFKLKETRETKKQPSPLNITQNERPLKIEFKKSISQLDAQEWDQLFADKGNLTYSALELFEQVFQNNQKPEDNWEFFYFIARDNNAKIVLATFYTCALMKDDMFASSSASKQIELKRSNDPYYLTSKTVSLGCPISKGSHLYLDQNHQEWKKALALMVEQIQVTVDQQNASKILLREFQMGENPELKEAMKELGFIEYRLLDNCVVNDLSWQNNDEYLKRLGQKYRYNVRREILFYENQFKVVTDKNITLEEVTYFYELYEKVFNGAFELNVFKLPLSFFQAVCKHPDYDIIRLYLEDSKGRLINDKPVAVMFSFVKSEIYSALIVGLDYDYLISHKIYKQILYQTVQRAWNLKCKKLDLAYTAVLEKKKVGARPYPTCAYVQSMDHYNQAVIDSLSGD